MKNAKKIGEIGRLILVLGSALYAFELLNPSAPNLTLPVSLIYAVALVLMIIGWIGTKDERKAAKAEARAQKKAA